MRTKILHKAKLIVKVIGSKKDRTINTESVFDNRTDSYWSRQQIKERGIERFISLDDLKESLNWNLNGNASLYQFKWGQGSTEETEGIAYIFD